MPEKINGHNGQDRLVHVRDVARSDEREERSEGISEFVHGLIEVGKERQGIAHEACVIPLTPAHR